MGWVSVITDTQIFTKMRSFGNQQTQSCDCFKIQIQTKEQTFLCDSAVMAAFEHREKDVTVSLVYDFFLQTPQRKTVGIATSMSQMWSWSFRSCAVRS